MAFRASSVVPEAALDGAKKAAVRLKQRVQSVSAKITASGLDGVEVIETFTGMKRVRDELVAFSSAPGIGQYAKDQENDQTYNVGTEFTALLAAIDAVIAEIFSTFPTNGGGYALTYQLNANGTLAPRTFTTAQLAGLKTALDALAAAIT